MIKNILLRLKSLKDFLLLILFLILITSNTIDLIEDGFNQEDSSVKLLTIIVSIWGSFILFNLIKKHTREISTLHRQVRNAENNIDLIHSKLTQIGYEYSKYLQKQFEAWELSNSEKEVAITLLKGLSFREIADIRNTKEKTVRQQASGIYKKSNVTGRHEFSAWFFEDMLV